MLNCMAWALGQQLMTSTHQHVSAVSSHVIHSWLLFGAELALVAAVLLQMVDSISTADLVLISNQLPQNFMTSYVSMQPSWRAVAAVLPQMPGGADILLADLELMARLAPDVLLLRQEQGCATPYLCDSSG